MLNNKVIKYKNNIHLLVSYLFNRVHLTFRQKKPGSIAPLMGKKRANPKKKGRPPATHGREMYTTIIDDEMGDKIRRIAITEYKTISDVLDEALTLYLASIKNGAAPRKTSKENRVRFTTMVAPEKRDEIKLIALDHKMDISDVFNDVISQFLSAKASNK